MQQLHAVLGFEGSRGRGNDADGKEDISDFYCVSISIYLSFYPSLARSFFKPVNVSLLLQPQSKKVNTYLPSRTTYRYTDISIGIGIGISISTYTIRGIDGALGRP